MFVPQSEGLVDAHITEFSDTNIIFCHWRIVGEYRVLDISIYVSISVFVSVPLSIFISVSIAQPSRASQSNKPIGKKMFEWSGNKVEENGPPGRFFIDPPKKFKTEKNPT